MQNAAPKRLGTSHPRNWYASSPTTTAAPSIAPARRPASTGWPQTGRPRQPRQSWLTLYNHWWSPLDPRRLEPFLELRAAPGPAQAFVWSIAAPQLLEPRHLAFTTIDFGDGCHVVQSSWLVV